METTITIFTNARVFTPTTAADMTPFQEAMIIKGSRIHHIGPQTDPATLEAQAAGEKEIDLHGHVVVPGFIDSHMHFLDFSLSQRKVNLLPCKSLDDIRSTIKRYAEDRPDLERIICKGWVQSSTGGMALARMLDDTDPSGRPIYVQAMDLHSVWCNTAALRELGADAMCDLPGGKIHRDQDGRLPGC